MGKSVPDRWLNYKCHGNVIKNTKIIAFKVPLKIETCRRLLPVDQFTPEILMESLPNLKYIIDLTGTSRYYRKTDFTLAGIKYIKVEVPGQRVPQRSHISQFFQAMDSFMAMAKDDELIGVHCTHGLNRTGFMVCQYLVRQLGWSVTDAIKEFEIARGHPIERQPYLKALELAPSGEKIISRIHNDLIKDKNNDHRNKNSEYSRWNDDKNNTRKYYPQRDCGPYDRRNDTNRKFKYPRINDQELSKNWRKNESNFSPSTTSSSSSSAPPRGQYDYPPRSFHHNWRESPINNHQNYSRNSNLPDQLIKSNFSLHKEQSEIVNSQNSSTSRLPAARFDNHSSIFYPNWRQSPSNDPQNNPKHVNHPEQLIESKILLHKNQTGVIDPNNSSSNCKVKMEKRGAIRRKDLKYSGKKS